MMETKLLFPTAENIALAGRLLRDGQIVALHTETVYGLAANAFDPAAVADIFAVKGRPQDNPLIVHIAGMPDIHRLVRWFPEPARLLAGAFWPGPLTMVLPKSDRVPDIVTCGLDTVAVRMPSSPVMLAVVRSAGVPLAAPSANLSGGPSPTRASHVMDDLCGKIPLIIDGGPCVVGVESTVISIFPDEQKNPLCERAAQSGRAVSDLCKIRLLRPGIVTAEDISEITGINAEIDPAVLSALPEEAAAASPGMKHRHYAPRAEVILAEGSLDGFIRLCADSDIENTWAMCFAGEGDQLGIPYVEYGSADDPHSQCCAIFDTLRRLDELGAERVYARAPAKDGVGLAAYNRLLRAAAFRVVNTDRDG